MSEQGLSAERLGEIRAREKAATFGRWEARPVHREWNEEGKRIFHSRDPNIDESYQVVTEWFHPQLDDQMPITMAGESRYYTQTCRPHMTKANAEFAAHAKTDVPDLLAEVDRLRAQVAALEAEREELREAFAWVLDRCGWREWYYWPPAPEVVKKLTNVDSVAVGDYLKLNDGQPT